MVLTAAEVTLANRLLRAGHGHRDVTLLLLIASNMKKLPATLGDDYDAYLVEVTALLDGRPTVPTDDRTIITIV